MHLELALLIVNFHQSRRDRIFMDSGLRTKASGAS
jgi:hypothetical protein